MKSPCVQTQNVAWSVVIGSAGNNTAITSEKHSVIATCRNLVHSLRRWNVALSAGYQCARKPTHDHHFGEEQQMVGQSLQKPGRTRLPHPMMEIQLDHILSAHDNTTITPQKRAETIAKGSRQIWARLLHSAAAQALDLARETLVLISICKSRKHMVAMCFSKRWCFSSYSNPAKKGATRVLALVSLCVSLLRFSLHSNSTFNITPNRQWNVKNLRITCAPGFFQTNPLDPIPPKSGFCRFWIMLVSFIKSHLKFPSCLSFLCSKQAWKFWREMINITLYTASMPLNVQIDHLFLGSGTQES